MAHPRLGAGALPAVVSLQSPPPTEGGRRSQDGRLTTVHPPGVAARHCSRLDHRCQGARATRQGSRHRTSTGNEAPGAHGPQPSCLQPQPPVSTSSSRAAESSRPAAGPGRGPAGSSMVQTLDRTESERSGIRGMRKMLKYIFGSWESEVKARRDQMKSFNDSFRPDTKG